MSQIQEQLPSRSIRSKWKGCKVSGENTKKWGTLVWLAITRLSQQSTESIRSIRAAASVKKPCLPHTREAILILTLRAQS